MTMRKWTVAIAGILIGLSGGGQAAAPAASASASASASPRPSVDDRQVLDACLSPADRQRAPGDFSPARRLQIVTCLTAASARQLEAQLPRQVDALTRLDQVSAAGTELTYHYSIGRSAADLPADVGARLESATRAYVCAQHSMVSTMQMGGAYVYRWADSAGQLIHQMRITGC
jgi:hypothetical protein